MNERTMTPSAAYTSIILGFLTIYVEMIAPGWIVPAVAGSVLVMLGIARLAAFPIQAYGAVLLAAALAAVALEAKWRARGLIALPAGLLMMAGARLLFSEPVRIRWWAAALSVPFAILTARLLTLALAAHRNKAIP